MSLEKKKSYFFTQINNSLRITPPLTLDYEILEKKLFLEFLAAKFNQNLGVVPVVAVVLYRDLKVIKFELQSCYYVHLLNNTLGKYINYLIPPPTTDGITVVLLQGRF